MFYLCRSMISSKTANRLDAKSSDGLTARGGIHITMALGIYARPKACKLGVGTMLDHNEIESATI
jgi:hypothetical protein